MPDNEVKSLINAEPRAPRLKPDGSGEYYIPDRKEPRAGLPVGRPPETRSNTDNVQTTPDPSFVRVEGTSRICYWSHKQRSDFHIVRAFLEGIGLTVIELDSDVDGKPSKRKRWTFFRMSLEDALDEVMLCPGIFFDEWVTFFLGRSEDTAVNRNQARKRATVALHNLHKDNKIAKRIAEDGRMVLYPAASAPVQPPTNAYAQLKGVVPDWSEIKNAWSPDKASISDTARRAAIATAREREAQARNDTKPAPVFPTKDEVAAARAMLALIGEEHQK